MFVQNAAIVFTYRLERTLPSVQCVTQLQKRSNTMDLACGLFVFGALCVCLMFYAALCVSKKSDEKATAMYEKEIKERNKNE